MIQWRRWTKSNAYRYLEKKVYDLFILWRPNPQLKASIDDGG
jgi:hypothetical protein